MFISKWFADLKVIDRMMRNHPGYRAYKEHSGAIDEIALRISLAALGMGMIIGIVIGIIF